VTTYIAFLRAVNVGGRVVKMDALRALISTLKVSNVETFIASGNLLFEAPAKSDKKIEDEIEKLLQKKLGYEVATFVRTHDEMAAIQQHRAFSDKVLKDALDLQVGFLKEPLTKDADVALTKLDIGTDEFHVHGRELYWLIRTKISESKVSNVKIEKAIGSPITFRNLNTVAKLTAKAATRAR
jgi:uncharacterized protein (DUF1697 family)